MKLTIDYPEGLEKALSTTRQEVEAQIRLMAALKMFELGKLSSGMAARLAGTTRVEFLDMCGRYRVSIINYMREGIDAELEQDLSALDR